MQWLDRFGRVLRSQLTHWQQQQEAPEQLLERLLNDMELELVEIRRALAAAIATYKSTERQREFQKLTATKWYERAQGAVSQGNEPLAREALTHYQSYQDVIQSLEHSLAEHWQVIERVRGELQALERKYDALKTQKSLYLARLQSAIAAQKIQEITDNMTGDRASSVFEQLESKILTLEVERSLGDPQAQSVEQKFRQLEQEQRISATLEAIKAQQSLPPE